MKKSLLLLSLLFVIFFLSGCSLSTNNSQPSVASLMPKATFLKTTNSGEVWEPKIQIDAQKNISAINVLSLVIDPFDADTVYLGSEKNGIFVSRDGAQSWQQISFPDKVYGIALDHTTREVIYASGVFKGRAKIFKKTGAQNEWNEVYTEPADGTVISALVMDRFNANVLYAGTSEGFIFKTSDGGNTWTSLYKAEAPVTSISLDSANSNIIYFGIFQRKLLKTENGGAQIEEVRIANINGNSSVFTVKSDPNISGTLYVGLADGIAKSVDRGQNWTTLNILGSSRNFPIRVIALNPQNPSEIQYVSGKAIYKSTDAGNTWSTFQLDTVKDVSSMVYNNNMPSIIYAGLRNF